MIKRGNIEEIIEFFAKHDKIFVSERDLQVNFAIKLQELNNKLSVIPEYVFEDKQKKDFYHIDLVVIDDDKKRIAFEFKYVTSKFVTTINNIEYELKNHAAIDIRRIQCYKDISRLETYIKGGFDKGYLVLLTNAKGFWEGAKDPREFELKEGIVIKNVFHKANTKSEMNCFEKEINNGQKGITLKNNYKVKWNDYKNFGSCLFRYLIIEVI